MAQVKLLARDGAGRGVVAVSGSKVCVGDQEIDRVQSVHLDGEPGKPWLLTIKVFVDPTSLFEKLPPGQD
ncbi:hypothetical protein [Variovorax sp. tm]|uniref:hypothetical protein n=1 Tax=Variovorax atrisoli TaxID=3394203 RepID=UPI003A80C5E1